MPNHQNVEIIKCRENVKIPITLGGDATPLGDAFGRLRISNPTTLFDSKQIYDNQPLLWDDQEVSGSGTSSSYSLNEARTRISVGASTAGKRIRQTFMRFNYQPGKSQLIVMTGVMGAGLSGITQEIGYFDDDNGMFFRCEDGVLKVVCRTKTSGTAVDVEVIQSDWNINKMDGTGDPGFNLDLSKTQIFFFDIEWLGVGRVRAGFFLDGEPYYCHEFLNANVLDKVYMSTPNLPLRYSIENDGTGIAANLDHICATVISEGGSQDTGVLRSYNMGNPTINANTVGTKYALIGIRLKSATIGASVKLNLTSILPTTSDHFIWEIIFDPTVAGTFTYSDQTNSVVQIAEGDTTGNPSTNTVTGGTVFQSGYGVDTVPVNEALDNAIRLGAAIDGTRNEIVLAVIPLTINLDIHGSLSWREIL